MFQLPNDAAAVLLSPLPHELDETLSPYLLPRPSLGCELSLDNILCGDSRVVRSRQPEGVVPLHPPPADEDVLYRVVQAMPHVERACHIGRRYDDCKRFLIRIDLGREQFLVFPEFVPLSLHTLRVVLLIHFHLVGLIPLKLALGLNKILCLYLL
jgi:hypothetical protein